jgi:hypothetical protein
LNSSCLRFSRVESIYTPRSYEAIGFDELRALAESHDITRLAIETRKDQIEKLEWSIRSRDGKPTRAPAASRIVRLTEFWRSPDGEQSFASWLREALEDVLVVRLITAVSQYIETWLNRRLAITDYFEMRDGAGGQKLQFGCFPVVAVLSLTIDGQLVLPALSSLAVGYSFSSTQLSVRGYKFSRGGQNIAIAYTAGYPTTPPEIAQVCIELVSLRYRERSRIGEVSRSLGGAETVIYSQKDMSEASGVDAAIGSGVL